ncbi:UDP-glucose dehydrogenase family protein [Paenibacillus phoenicis]|uniref:UDP-glucose dehydrogenase family protein n=1 Tax=Paenibacillus phoenicis TaxID=554117 RepID=UPI003D2BDAD8
MNIAVIGTGYVGLTSGVCFAELGNNVICVDINVEKIEQLNNGVMPIYEPGLEELVLNNKAQKRISFTTNFKEAVHNSEIIIIAVGTPSLADGDVDLSYVRSAAKEIANHINDYKVIVNKSTVPVGTGELVENIIRSTVREKLEFDVASVPEFLREGTAVKDFFNTERIVIGTNSEKAKSLLVDLHSPLNTFIQITDIRSAELIKYAANSFLAMKISFINEIANLAETLGADITDIAEGIGSDSRIGKKFLAAGIGFGGACFPKDTNGLIKIAEKAGHDFKLLQEVVNINQNQYKKLIDKLKLEIDDICQSTISILGLSFKPNTDDIRDAPSIKLIKDLLTLYPGVEIRVYDPIAMPAVRDVIGEKVFYSENIEQAVDNCDALLIVTEWNEFIDFGLERYKKLLKHPVIIDGRNCFDLTDASDQGITYHSIGRKPVVTEFHQVFN